jgi:hypothetical protein
MIFEFFILFEKQGVTLYLDAKPSHVGADVDGLACRLHRPMDCG